MPKAQDDRLEALRTAHDLKDGDACGHCREIPIGANIDCTACVDHEEKCLLLDVIDGQAARIRKLETMLESNGPRKKAST